MRLLLLMLCLAHAGTDRDGDGVLDGEDACPSLPEDLDGFQDADGCPDPDNDGDGVSDVHDQCPTEPEDVDGHADFDGCPDPDNDGDGLSDREDPCPDAAGEGGCPAEADAIAVPFAKLTGAIARGDAVEARHAFTEQGWEHNLVGASGLRGRKLFEQGHRSGWSLVPTAPPLMLGPTLASVPCAVRTIADARDLETVTALVARTERGWRILAAGEQAERVKAAGARWLAEQPEQGTDEDEDEG